MKKQSPQTKNEARVIPKRGPKTKENIKFEILAIKKGDRDDELSAKDIRELLRKAHPGCLKIPTERVIYNILRKNKDDIKFELVDGPWTIGACLEYKIPAEMVPVLMKAQKWLADQQAMIESLSVLVEVVKPIKPILLSIRSARWISFLYPILNPLATDNYPAEIDRLGVLVVIAQQYSLKEQIANIQHKRYTDTPYLDNRIATDFKAFAEESALNYGLAHIMNIDIEEGEK